MRLLETIFAITRICRRMAASIPFGGKCQCNMCDRRVQRFLPYRGGWADVPPLMKQLGIVGSDVENYECPACGCHDRERHLLMYLTTSGLLSTMKGARILHLAPERHLQRFIRNAMPTEYIQGDLYPDRPGIKRIDLHAVPYPDDYFDFVLANHVLEHVQDDIKALNEIFRILRTGGYAILQTPYSSILTQMFQDSGIQSNQARLQAYGQEDHCRLYGQDVFQRFEAIGFRSLTIRHFEMLGHENSTKKGIKETLHNSS